MVCLLSLALYASLFLSGSFVLLYLYFKHQYKSWKRMKIPYIEPKFPFGSISGVGVTQSAGESGKVAYDKSVGKPFVGLYTFASPYLLVRDPDLVKEIIVKDFMTFQDRGFYYNEKVDPLSATLFTMGGGKWKKLRVKLSPTFTSGKMKMMFPILSEKCKIFVDLLKEPAGKGQVIEMKDYSARFTTDIIASCAFGIQADSMGNKDSTFRVMGNKIVEPSFGNNFRATMVTYWPEMAERLGVTFSAREVTRYFLHTFRDTMKYRQENNVKGSDFMQLLIQLMEKGRIEEGDDNSIQKTDESGKFTFEEAAAEAFVFFLGGFETSSTTMTFALYELAVNPEIQETLREEILRVLEKHDNVMTYEAIYEMDYLKRVIDEALRKYPPAPILFRASTKPFKLPDTDVVLPAGTRIQIPIFGIQNDPKYFPNPERFDPDRFTEEEKSKRHKFAYLPFGEGPRVCIGLRFGLMQTMTGLIALLSNYRFEVSETTPVPMVFDKKAFFLSPEGGMNLKITKL